MLTIIIPAFNMAKFIFKTLDSLESQMNKNFEVLIVDDGSTDNTFEVVSPYLNRNPSWKYYKKDNGNTPSVINYVIKNNLINGNYVTIIDADDWYKKEAVQTVLDTFYNDQEIDVLITDFYNYKKRKNLQKDKITRKWSIPFKSKYVDKKKAINPNFQPLCNFYKANIFKKLPYLPENRNFYDLHLFAQLIKLSKKRYYLNKPLAYYWQNRSNNESGKLYEAGKLKNSFEELFFHYQLADQIDPNNREVAGIVLATLFYNRKYVRKYFKMPDSKRVEINSKGVKMKWLPWYVRYFFPIVTFCKITTRKWWVQKGN